MCEGRGSRWSSKAWSQGGWWSNTKLSQQTKNTNFRPKIIYFYHQTIKSLITQTTRQNVTKYHTNPLPLSSPPPRTTSAPSSQHPPRPSPRPPPNILLSTGLPRNAPSISTGKTNRTTHQVPQLTKKLHKSARAV